MLAKLTASSAFVALAWLLGAAESHHGCWMLLAFVKATDTRRNASFVVRREKSALPRGGPREAYPEYEDDKDGGEYYDGEEERS